MKRAIAEHWTFFREFRSTFHTTGALAPSGRRLAAAFAKPLQSRPGGLRILEVGAGTGAITAKLVQQVQPDDQFDIVELNDRFVEVLRQRFKTEPAFMRVADRSKILHQSVEELPIEPGYDFIACGLPFNNFDTASVRRLLRHLMRLLQNDDSTFCFFEYVWIRGVKSLASSTAERKRLAKVARVMQYYVDRHEYGRNLVLANVPPAVVHFLRKAPLTPRRCEALPQ